MIMAEEPKKNIFNARLEELEAREEKAAAEAAKKGADAAQAELEKANAAVEAAQKNAVDLRNQLAQMQQNAQFDAVQQARIAERSWKPKESSRKLKEPPWKRQKLRACKRSLPTLPLPSPGTSGPRRIPMQAWPKSTTGLSRSLTGA
jgi:predicted RNase H-like nuclease (RuvC/YqgF family)